MQSQEPQVASCGAAKAASSDRRERRLLVGAPQLRRPAPQPHHVVGAQQPRVRGAAQLEDVRRGGECGDVSAVGGRALQQLHRLQLGELDEAERGARRPQRVLQEAQLRAGRRKVEEAAHLPRAGNQGGAHAHMGIEREGACAPSRDVEGGQPAKPSQPASGERDIGWLGGRERRTWLCASGCSRCSHPCCLLVSCSISICSSGSRHRASTPRSSARNSYTSRDVRICRHGRSGGRGKGDEMRPPTRRRRRGACVRGWCVWGGGHKHLQARQVAARRAVVRGDEDEVDVEGGAEVDRAEQLALFGEAAHDAAHLLGLFGSFWVGAFGEEREESEEREEREEEKRRRERGGDEREERR